LCMFRRCVQGTYCGGWRRCACLDAKTRVLAVGALASTTCNNFIADLLFLSEVPHSLLVAGGPCAHPYLGKSALDSWRCRMSDTAAVAVVEPKEKSQSPGAKAKRLKRLRTSPELRRGRVGRARGRKNVGRPPCRSPSQVEGHDGRTPFVSARSD
jgi:hypothetical protein